MSQFSVMKDAFWQIAGRMISALSGFYIIKIISPLLGTLRYGDYSTILSYFALWSALSDLGLYVIGLKELGKLKHEFGIHTPADLDHLSPSQKEQFSQSISQFVRARIGQIVIVYSIAILVAYLIPSYSDNPYIARGLPLGMLFSAGFMIAGIIQLPLQLFWKMEHVSIALILARISQLIVIRGITQRGWRDLTSIDQLPLSLFLIILSSVVISALTQIIYTRRHSSRIIQIRYVSFWKPMRRHIQENGKYGMAFFLSSFHLLIVSLLLSVMYPTLAGYNFVGIRGLGLQLIQILLIIPTAIANSLIHKITNLPPADQKISFGHLLNIILVFGWICIANFSLFATPMITFIGKSDYLTTGDGFHREGVKALLHSSETINIGSDFILPGLAIVLALSFIKTIFNYIFIASNRHNVLFYINLFGVVVGTLIALIALHTHNIVGGLFAQICMEILFVIGSRRFAHRYDIVPKISRQTHISIHLIFVVGIAIVRYLSRIQNLSTTQFLISFMITNIILIGASYPFIRQEFSAIGNQLHTKNTENHTESQL